MTETASPFGEILYGYFRSDALADGILIEADPAICKEAGIKIPAAITDHLWGVISPDNLDDMPGQSINGRLWDLLWMFRIWVSDPKHRGQDRGRYKVIFLMKRPGCPARLEEFEVMVMCGPGDSGEPVLTFMFPEDD